jgi:hypothetical protein
VTQRYWDRFIGVSGPADHWLSRSDTRLQMLEVSVAFLRARNPPTTP